MFTFDSYRLLTLLAVATLAAPSRTQQVSIAGADDPALRRWHAIALDLQGPMVSESGVVNPFLDLRMNVEFSHAASGTSFCVAGHFAADGDAADSSAVAGSVWRAWLSPDHVGTWSYAISFRSGTDVSISLDPAAGAPLAPFDGIVGTFEVVETDKGGRDHRAKGRLRYVGRHHLRFADGTWFWKAGADSPENLLAYDDIDNTPNIGNRRKSWAPHLADWHAGDPTWQGNKGRGLIGALNYLASEGLNALSFLTYNHNGDDKNVYPYVDPNVRTRFDCSKLDQWEIVFRHADRLGLHLHFKTQETENDQDMDGGALGIERKLYYRELVSRFGHHLALNWNLGEENTNTTAQRIEFAQWFRALDPYGHPIVVHTFPGQQDAIYTPLLGTASELTGVSLQTGPSSVFGDTRTWVQRSAAAGRPWVVANDEQGNAQTGIVPDAVDPDHDSARSDVLWGNLMAGGAGIECYFGYGYAHSDLTCQDFRSRDLWWDQCRHAIEFLADNRVPFADMRNDDSLVGAGHCLSGAAHYVVYLENGGSTTLDLSAHASTDNFDVHWFDPRAGGALQAGATTQVSGGAVTALGAPPTRMSTATDWTVLVRRSGFEPARVVHYGTGCAGTLAAPDLHADGLPILANPDFALRATGLPSTAPAALLVGFGRISVPLGGGCSLWVDRPVAIGRAADLGGVARFCVRVPPQPALVGFVANFEALILDPRGPALGGVVTTPAIEAVLGS